MAHDLRYRAIQHNGEKKFDDQPRVLTYRGATYQTRVFQAQLAALQTR